MLEFFIGLFGIIFICAELIREQYCKKEMQNSVRRTSVFNSIIQNSEFAYNNTPKNTDEYWIMLNDIDDELKEVFGGDWKSIYQNYGYEISKIRNRPRYSSFGNITNLAFEIWLSKNGFVPLTKDKYNYRFFIDGVEEGKQGNIAVKVCKIIERNLQQHHPKLNMRLYKIDNTYFGWEYDI